MEEHRQYNKDYRNRQKAIGDVNGNGVNMAPRDLIGYIIVTPHKIRYVITWGRFRFFDELIHFETETYSPYSVGPS